MIEALEKQYIFELSSGRTINIYYKEHVGICLSVLYKKNFWLAPSVIMKNAMPGFSAYMDDSDIIHILCQDWHGNIMYVFNDKSTWYIKPVLISKNSSPLNKYFWITRFKSSIYFLYVLTYSEKKLLSYQIINDSDSPSVPKAIDYIQGGEIPYKVLKSTNNNLYIFYKRTLRKQSHIGYKIFNLITNHLSEFIPLDGHEIQKNDEIVSVVEDCQNNLHVCMQRFTDNNYNLVYLKKSPDCEYWSNKRILASASSSFTNSSFALLKKKLIVYWIMNNTIHYSISMDNGEIWSTKSPYTFNSNTPMHCISFKSNKHGEYTGLQFDDLPGFLYEGYKLAFINDLSFIKENIFNQNLYTKVIAELNRISQSTDGLRDNFKCLANSVDDMEESQKVLENIINKHSDILKLVDSNLSKLKSKLEIIKEMKDGTRVNASDDKTH